ncbi:MAG: hypothetical protein AAFX99_20170 [Myxococcota bacterium]
MHTLDRHAVGGFRCGEPRLFGKAENPQGVGEDVADEPVGPLLAVALQLEIDVHQAPCVDDIVGGVENAALGKFNAVPIFQKLVVGGSSDDLATEVVEGVVVDNPPHGTGRQHIALHLKDIVGGYDLHPRVDLLSAFKPIAIQIGHNDVGPLISEQLDQLMTHAADPLDGHGTPFGAAGDQGFLGEDLW